MKYFPLLLFVGLAVIGPGRVWADPGLEVRVPQAGRGSVLDWVVLDDSQLLLQTRDRQWYRVRLFMPSWGLASAQSLGFVTGPDGDLAAGGQLLIGAQRYPVVSVTAAEAPARKPRPGAVQ
ncbi:hypothetical protein [Zoogloea sp.]|uniref:hypothetical protein n=1 Tax=Zoogloea sp. TaxID=49181 RepID=UPI0035B24024